MFDVGGPTLIPSKVSGEPCVDSRDLAADSRGVIRVIASTSARRIVICCTVDDPLGLRQPQRVINFIFYDNPYLIKD